MSFQLKIEVLFKEVLDKKDLVRGLFDQKGFFMEKSVFCLSLHQTELIK